MTIEELASIGAEAGALLKARGETLAVGDGATGGLMSAGLLAMGLALLGEAADCL